MKYGNLGLSLLLAVTMIYFQAYFLAPSSSGWFRIDISSILVCYFIMERVRWNALLHIAVITFLISSLSAAPVGFYWMYHLAAIAVAMIVLRFIVARNFGVFGFYFVVLVVMKYILFFFVIKNSLQSYSILVMIKQHMTSFIATIVSMPLVFSGLKLFDKKYPFSDAAQSAIEVRF